MTDKRYVRRDAGFTWHKGTLMPLPRGDGPNIAHIPMFTVPFGWRGTKLIKSYTVQDRWVSAYDEFLCRGSLCMTRRLSVLKFTSKALVGPTTRRQALYPFIRLQRDYLLGKNNALKRSTTSEIYLDTRDSIEWCSTTWEKTDRWGNVEGWWSW